MLAFIDESGHPHPNDPNQRPVVVAVCMEERQGRLVAGRLHGLKRDFLGRERTELKGNKFINRRTFRRKPEYVSFLEEFFNTLLNLPLTVFAVIMQAPFERRPSTEDSYLPNRFRFLVQRIELLAEEQDKMATIMFDKSLHNVIEAIPEDAWFLPIPYWMDGAADVNSRPPSIPFQDELPTPRRCGSSWSGALKLHARGTGPPDCMGDWAGNLTASSTALKREGHTPTLLMPRLSLIHRLLPGYKSLT